MFFDLPSDISLSILQDWLADLKFIAALDAAAAPSARSDYLDLVAHPALVLPLTAVEQPQRLQKLIANWVNTRAVKLSALEIQASMLTQCAKIGVHCLSTVRKLVVCNRPANMHNYSISIKKLLKVLPLLEELDLSKYATYTTAYMKVLSSSFGPSLKRIHLDCSLTSCDDIVPLITALGANLLALDFGRLRNISCSLLHLTASVCTNLRECTITCVLNDSQDFVSILASHQCFPLLERIKLRSTAPLRDCISDGTARAIFQHMCSVLNGLFLTGASITDLSLSYIAGNCKSLTKLMCHNEPLLTDFGISFLLHNIGDQLTDFHLVGCTSLTSSSLLHILRLCNKLKLLEVCCCSGISVEMIQIHLLSSVHNYLPLLVKFLVNSAVYFDLLNFVNDPSNYDVDKKWARLLAKSASAS